MDVRWGDISVVDAEFALFDEAYRRGEYSYYHLLSGVDMPLKTQNYIHRFFEKNAGMNRTMPNKKQIPRVGTKSPQKPMPKQDKGIGHFMG